MKIKTISLYDDIPIAGECPVALKGKQTYAFVPSDQHTHMIKDAVALAQAKLIWAFKCTAKEVMFGVYGIVLCAAKQIIVTASERTASS